MAVTVNLVVNLTGPGINLPEGLTKGKTPKHLWQQPQPSVPPCCCQQLSPYLESDPGVVSLPMPTEDQQLSGALQASPCYWSIQTRGTKPPVYRHSLVN